MAVRAFPIVEDHDHKSADEKSGSAHSHAHEGDEHQAESHGAEHEHEHAAVAGDHGHDHGHEADFANVAGRKAFYLSSDHLMNHVQDQPYFEIPNGTQYPTPIPIPNPLGYTYEKPMVHAPKGLETFVGPISFQPTKFVVLELIAALIIAAVAIPYARRVKGGDAPKGKFWNMVDSVICYVKDELAEPAIGKADAKRFLPLLWTIFFFVLILNLLGMIPGLGAATGSISVTAALAMVIFAVVVGAGSKKMGIWGFWKAQVPHMELPSWLSPILIPMIWLIEVFGMFVKHFVLAIRLFANMFAGHLVLAVFVGLIGVFGWVTSVAVGPGMLGVSVLELLVAFIQAYVFTFLSALFIGAAVHPH